MSAFSTEFSSDHSLLFKQEYHVTLLIMNGALSSILLVFSRGTLVLLGDFSIDELLLGLP